MNESMSTDLKRRVRFPNISSRAWEHPADRAALVALRAVPGFDLVLRKLLGLVGEKSLRLVYLGSAVRVTERQFKDVHRIYQECCDVLDVHEVPELFVSQTPFVNAGAVGFDRPFITLNSGTLAILDRDELRVVLGHELGHVLSGHVLYKTMLGVLMRISLATMGIPVATWTLFAIIAALKEWDRKSELSSDRAGLLVAQSPTTCMRLQMKMAGGGKIDEMELEEFLLQAQEYEAGGDLLDSVFKLLNIMGQSHPFPVLRLAELKTWVDKGEYDEILRGRYPLRTDDARASVLEELKASTASYKEKAEESKDPLVSFFRDLGGSVSTASERLWERFKKD